MCAKQDQIEQTCVECGREYVDVIKRDVCVACDMEGPDEPAQVTLDYAVSRIEDHGLGLDALCWEIDLGLSTDEEPSDLGPDTAGGDVEVRT